MNQLFLNQGNQTFSEESILSGVAYNYAAQLWPPWELIVEIMTMTEKLDLVISNFEKEVPVLYRGQGTGLFDDVSIISGLGIANRYSNGE